MGEHSFTDWLDREVSAARCSLLALYEQRDKLRFIERPNLEREYMEKVGEFEEKIIQEEIEVELLQKKQQMIQTALNRREPIDEAAIDAKIEELRQQKLKEAASYFSEEGSDGSDVMNLTNEQTSELQELYHTIVKCYHPQMHPELTEAHKLLFQKARDAYRRKDLESLRLIHDLLLRADGDVDLGELLEFLMDSLVTEKMEIVRRDYSTDYALASTLYQHFIPTSEEAAIQEQWNQHKAEADVILASIENMRKNFPFTAVDMLSSPEKVEEYKKELEYRSFEAQKEREKLRQQIRNMMERVAAHE